MSKILVALAAIAIVAFVVDAVNQGKQQGHLTGFAAGKKAPEKREAGFAPEGGNAKPKRATDEHGPEPPPGSK
ncbi:hypothetical protein AAVH_18887 [Aphelenchoides avenae]|nr:hypothetical protein AAVH_18887 [Aphelenchus avenae]